MDFTDSRALSRSLAWLVEEHSAALHWVGAYILFKLAGRLAFGGSSRVWDNICLVHNVLSVLLGLASLSSWERGPSGTCASLSDDSAVVILLQLAHSVSDFVVFLPQMVAEPLFIYHHAVLAAVSLVLPHCRGCRHVVFAYSLAEFGSAAIAIDVEWRRSGGYSRGLKRMVVFGLTRVVNLYMLWRIWLVTPSSHEFSLTDGADGSTIAKFNLPICMVTAVGGSSVMLAINGITWWRMLQTYLRVRRERRSGEKDE